MSIVNKDSYLTLLLVALWPYVTVVLCECGKINRLLVGRMAKGPNTRAALTIYSHFMLSIRPRNEEMMKRGNKMQVAVHTEETKVAFHQKISSVEAFHHHSRDFSEEEKSDSIIELSLSS